MRALVSGERGVRGEMAVSGGCLPAEAFAGAGKRLAAKLTNYL